MGRYPHPPQNWAFSEEDREAKAGLFWNLPVRVVTGGLWADLWRNDETARGGGTVSSVLPVIAGHVFPTKRSPFGSDSSGLWTPWDYLSVRRIARLAGVGTDTVTTVCRRLESLELMQRQTAPPPDHQGGPPRRLYRLASRLYAAGQDLYAKISLKLFYHGHWSVLPTASSRHLYIALAALDPVLDEESFAATVATAGGETGNVVLDARRRSPQSIAQLAEATGMRRSTVEEALRVLRTPQFWRGGNAAATKGGRPDLPLIDSGPATASQAFWFAPARAALSWHFKVETLNAAGGIAKAQTETWPFLAERRIDAARRKRLTAARADQQRRQNAGRKAAQTRKERAEQSSLTYPMPGTCPPDPKDVPPDMGTR